jgi:SprT-like protein
MKISLEELNTYAKKQAKKQWGLQLNVTVTINGRLSRSLGRFGHTKTKPLYIQLSKKLVENYEPHEIKDVLLHELTHWALFTLNKPCKDGHPVFEKELKRVGACSTRTYEIKGEAFQLHCKNCGRLVGETNNKRQSTNWLNRGVSKCCMAKLERTFILK